MARYAVSPSGDVILAMSITEAMALQRTVDASPSQMRAAGRVRQILDAAVIDAKGKGQSRPCTTSMKH